VLLTRCTGVIAPAGAPAGAAAAGAAADDFIAADWSAETAENASNDRQPNTMLLNTTHPCGSIIDRR
jgi:hypothetical protein